MTMSWNSLQVEAAMCLWDSLNEAWATHYDKANETVKADAPQWFRDVCASWDGHGSLGMMHAVRHAAFEVEALWERFGDELTDGVVYDWEYIPEALQWIDWAGIDSSQIARLKPEAHQALREWIEVQRKRLWLEAAQHNAKQLYGYAEMVAEHADWFDRDFEAGVAARASVEAFGEKYDLTPVGRW